MLNKNPDITFCIESNDWLATMFTVTSKGLLASYAGDGKNVMLRVCDIFILFMVWSRYQMETQLMTISNDK